MYSQQKQRPARARNSKRRRRSSDSSEGDSGGSDDASESDGSRPRRRVSNAMRNPGKSSANGGSMEDSRRPPQKPASALPHRAFPGAQPAHDTAQTSLKPFHPRHHDGGPSTLCLDTHICAAAGTAVQGSLNGFVQRPAVKVAAKQPAATVTLKRKASIAYASEPSPVVQGRTTPRRASAAVASRRLVVSDTSSDDGGEDARGEHPDDADDSESPSSGSSDGA